MDARKKKAFGLDDWLGRADTFRADFGSIPIDPIFDPAPLPPTTRTNIGHAPADPLFAQQWHLFDAEGVDMDINVTRAWLDYTGRGVKVGVYDDAVQYDHPDLTNNYDRSLHFTYAKTLRDPMPTAELDKIAELNHGTQVAGIIAAEEGNGIGGVGVAFDATITAVPIYGLIDEDSADYRLAAMRYQDRFDVVNHSWGGDPFVARPAFDEASRAGIEHAADAGRGGLGTVIVACAVNSRESGGDANAALAHNHDRHVVTVASAGSDGYVASNSNPGANLLVTAPSFGRRDGLDRITTTDRTGADGVNLGDYTDQFGGTSAAAAMVSGAAALMLEANPNLGWRDVREILAYSSRHIGADIGPPRHYELSPWRINHAADWNGGGLHFSRDYGFGLVDALAAVRLAETWTEQKTSANEEHAVASFAHRAPITIPDNLSGGFTYRLEIIENISIESITLSLDFTHRNVGDLTIEVTSPTGTVSSLLWRNGGDQDIVNGWSFTGNKFWGESSFGIWTVNIADRAAANVGTIRSGALDVYGSAASASDTYIYTNEFSVLIGVGDDTSRGTLNDRDGGIDTINASAVGGDIYLDLSAARASTIAGRSLSIVGIIENAYTGDGNDTLIGNDSPNVLKGMRGTDTIDGGGSSDTLAGGLGNDWLDGGTGLDFFLFDTALDARNNVDTIKLFNVAEDTIRLENSTFTRLPRVMGADAFHTGFAAHDATDRIIYNSATGALSYDADGNGSGAAVQFATLSTGLAMTHADFAVI